MRSKSEHDRHLLMTLVTVVILFAFIPSAMEKTSEKVRNYSAFIAPVSLSCVEEEAFADTAFQKVVLNEKLVYLGEKAFWNSQPLQSVYIPESTVYVGLNAFPSNTLIHSSIGSYAQQWAMVNGYRFQSNNEYICCSKIMLSILLLSLSFLVGPIAEEKSDEYRFRCVKAHLMDMRPQNRSELYPINYRFP